MEVQNKIGFNRDAIKYVAMLTMFLNHFAHIFLKQGTTLYEILINTGYFTAVTMCYFLVEGYGYTRSKKNYAKRLLLFAILSQIPYVLALKFYQLNMMFTLFLCFIILYILDNMKSQACKVLSVTGLLIVSVFSDWALLAPLFTLLFAWSKNNKRKQAVSFGLAAVLFSGFSYLTYSMTMQPAGALKSSIQSSLGILAAGVVILVFYNGKQTQQARTFSKWFFYLFYPAHLLLLWIVHMIL